MSEKIYRVALVGFCHMHINSVAGYYYEHPRTEIVAAADTKPFIPELNPDGMFARNWNKAHCVKKFEIPKVYDDYLEMLDTEKPDLAVICCENAVHPEVVEECGKRGIDCFVEKPMAMNLDDALNMVRSMEHYGHKVLINWMMPFSPAYNKMKELFDSGAVGKLIEFKCRVGNMGPLGKGSKHPGIAESGVGLTEAERGSTWWHQLASGGGAMTDFGAYGCLMSTWFIGEKAISAYGLRGNFTVHAGNADDESVIVARYPSAIAICEGTWTSMSHSDMGVNGPILHGELGDMWIGKDGVMLFLNDENKTTCIAPDPQPEELLGVANSYIYLKETGKYAHVLQDPVFNLNGVALLDAGARSSKSGKAELLNDLNWHIG